MNSITCVKLASLVVVVLATGAWLAAAEPGIPGPPVVAPLPQPEAYGCFLGNPTVYRYALPYVYAYAPPRVADRVASILNHYVPPFAIAPPLASRPSAISPYSAYANQPAGQPTEHKKIWTSPNSYGYRPLYSRSPSVAGASKPTTPTLASPSTRPESVQADLSSPAVGGDAAVGAPEVIPAPPAEGSLAKAGPHVPAPLLPAAGAQQGPREF